ncbi:MAG: exonuclease domain-containing protein [Lachnospiraceae bacterium]|nr:exonuclease domain-containing protein [Lachnospiraceae bacterium]
MNKNYIVLDLEWNQGNPKTELSEIPFEIVEIGAVKLNSNHEIIDTFERLIRPQIYTKMHFATRKLIHLTTRDLENEDIFPLVYEEFLKWCGEDFIFCTWGTQDLQELQRNIRFYILPPLGDRPFPYLDVQKLFSLAKEDGKSRRSLEYAVDFMGLQKKDAFHRAENDAVYTAEILQEIAQKKLEERVSFDVFHLPKSPAEELHVTFDTYSKYISRAFPDKSSVMRDKEATSCRCYLCNKDTRHNIDWFSASSKYYLFLGTCKDHGPMRGKLRIKKSEDGNIYVVKTIRRATEEDITKLKEKAEKAHLAAQKAALYRAHENSSHSEKTDQDNSKATSHPHKEEMKANKPASKKQGSKNSKSKKTGS